MSNGRDLLSLAEVERFTRRDFLRSNSAFGVLLAASCGNGPKAAGSDGSHHGVLAVVGTALLGLGPQDKPFDPESVDRLVRKVFPSTEIDLVKVVSILARVIHYQPVFGLRFKTFGRLTREEQEEVLEGWLDSRIDSRRMLMVLLRTLCAMAHYGREEVWPEIGYDGPWVGRIPMPHVPVKVTSGVSSADDPETPAEMDAHTVVIGFGAGGGVAATELADRGVEVLALEAGAYVTSDQMNQREEEMIPRLFNEFGFRQTADRRINVIQGRGVGGSTVHNINLCYRAPEWIFEDWRRRSGVEDMSVAGMERHYQAVETRIRVTRIDESQVNLNNKVAVSGSQKLGWLFEVARHNRTDCLGSGFCELGCAYDRKNNIPVAFLPSFVAHGGKVVTNCRAQRIAVEGGSVVAVEAKSAAGRTMKIRCKRVIVSAGGIDSPVLLIRSGLGASNPRIGAGLHLHPGTSVAGLFDEPIEGWRGLPQSVVVTEFFKPRPEGSYVVVSAFGHPMLFSGIVPGVGRFHRDAMTQYRHVAALSPFIHDRTEGQVSVHGAGRPRIKYALTPSDLETLRESWVHCAKLLFAAGAKKVMLTMPKGAILEKPEEITRIAEVDMRSVPYVSVHPQSTCGIGSDPTKGAADPYGAVFGVKGVYVCDTSLYPDSIGVPPQLTAMALGHRLAEHLAAQS
ncbi:MAG: GMC family oxidoreductase [Nitrospirae bacterium]|nr:GMC family oxidoreductase [Nitrospirota bacterium]